MSENLNNYIEVGEIEGTALEGSKQGRIRMLSEMGLIVPPTFVINPRANDSLPTFSKWAEAQMNQGMEFMLRTDIIGVHNSRNMPSIRDATREVGDIWKAAMDFINETKTGVVIIQALSPNSINEDILSANFQIHKDQFTGILSATVEACPDIAPLINRMNLTPTFILDRNGEFTLNNHDFIWDVILYRVGRDVMRKKGVKLPKIEELPNDFQIKYFNVLQEGKIALEENQSGFPAPSYWQEVISSNTLHTEDLKDKVLKILEDEKNKLLRRVTKFKPSFESNLTMKMSFIGENLEKLTPVYWDIVEMK